MIHYWKWVAISDGHVNQVVISWNKHRNERTNGRTKERASDRTNKQTHERTSERANDRSIELTNYLHIVIVTRNCLLLFIFILTFVDFNVCRLVQYYTFFILYICSELVGVWSDREQIENFELANTFDIIENKGRL
jgi:hypothetical protein